MITLTRRLEPEAPARSDYTLALTAEERTRSRLKFRTQEGIEVQLRLPRGTVLRDGDLLATQDRSIVVRVRARPEPVMTARADSPWTLLRAAYHLGNRHVPVEVGAGFLRFAQDAVLADMLLQLGLIVVEEVMPFQPEAGAYGSHTHAHAPPLYRSA